MLLARFVLVAVAACLGAVAFGFLGRRLGEYLERRFQGRYIADTIGGLAFFWGIFLGGFAAAYFLFD